MDLKEIELIATAEITFFLKEDDIKALEDQPYLKSPEGLEQLKKDYGAAIRQGILEEGADAANITKVQVFLKEGDR